MVQFFAPQCTFGLCLTGLFSRNYSRLGQAPNEEPLGIGKVGFFTGRVPVKPLRVRLNPGCRICFSAIRKQQDDGDDRHSDDI